MLFEDDIPQDKGLFTFYKEQQEKQEELKRVKKLNKNAKNLFIQELIHPNHSSSIFRPQKQQNPKPELQQIKPKVGQPKQRYHQSVVDMGQLIDDQQKRNGRNPLAKPKFKEPSFVSKTRKYRQKITQFNNSMERESHFFHEEYIPDQIKIQSYHRRNLSEHLQASRTKPVIHSVKGIELPQIRRSVEIPYKPKKSLKSKLIQQALKLKDKEKIKNIREYIKATPYPCPCPEQEPELELEDQLQVDSKSFSVFHSHQQKIMGIIKKFRRGRE